jgi:hypothetical protein
MEQGSSDSRKRGRYEAAEIPTDAKEALAAMCVQMTARGMSQADYLEAMVAAGYPVSKQTLSVWVRHVKR